MKNNGAFTDEQLDTLIYAALPHSSEDKIVKFLEWATLTVVRYAILEGIMEGNTKITVAEDGEPVFASHLNAPTA